ncbi:hypothetical protein SNE40_016625 [Patella caerulea]|uniref:OCIA domain-containing protein n=1 Tax=Patella caerulea TaxID=87958 RepID=A0AAN8J911_PATCE
MSSSFSEDTNNQKRIPRGAFSKEELELWAECRHESFWYRCLPFSVGGVLAVHTLTTLGVLKPHPRYGALFKNMGVVLLGYFAGKASYMETCKNKFRQRLPNSRMTNLLSGRGFNPEQNADMTAPAEVNKPEEDKPLRETYSSLDLNDQYLDNRPVSSTDDINTRIDSNQKPTLTYDELRAKNRADAKKDTNRFPRPWIKEPESEPEPTKSHYQSILDNNKKNNDGQKRNQYGDVLDS